MKRFLLGTHLFLALSLALLFAACGGGTPVEEPGMASDLTTPAGDRPGAQPLVPGGVQETPQHIQEEKRDFLVREYLKLARADFDLGNYEAAYEQLTKAQELDPGKEEVKEWLTKVAALLGDRPGEASEVQKRILGLEKARVEKTRMEVEDQMIRADLAVEQKRYQEAVNYCDTALLMIRYNPYIEQGDQLITKVRAKKAAIQKRIEEVRRMDRERQAELAREELADREAQRRRRQFYKVNRLFKEANLAFAAGRYPAATNNLEVVLELDPGNNAALRLIELSRQASHETNQQRYQDQWKMEWAKTFADIEQSDVPMVDPIKFDRRHWKAIKDRKPLGGFEVEKAESSIEDKAILEKLNSVTVDPTFTEAELKEWVEYFRQVTGVNFVVSQTVRELSFEETQLVNLPLNKMPAAKALDVICKLKPLKWKIENGVVHIISKEESVGKTYTLFYEVRDLVARLNHFPGKEIHLNPPGSEPMPQEPPEPLSIILDGDTLVGLIQDNIATMGGGADNSLIQMLQDQGVIVARTTEAKHERIKTLLEGLRINTGILVNIEARFLNVEDKFLEEIGVDLRGLGDDASSGAPGKGLTKSRSRPATRFDDYGTGITPTTPGLLGTGTEPGIFFDDGNDGDLMARTENLYDMALGNPSEGMDNAGGLGLQYTYLDDVEIEAILRAVAKRERVQQINAPNMLVFNTQRASLTITKSVSYVRDFDVEIAQAASVANPVVGTVSDGIVLDVHPVVSADRRFITMELRPTLAQLEEPIPTYTTTLGVGQEISIQLPTLQIQRVRTTVRLPDGGTLMLGGMKVARKQDYKSGVPVLQDLPLLSFFFSRRGTYKSNRKVYILLKASIVIPPEFEPQTLVQNN